MDLKQLTLLVSKCPPLWDRSHEKFRDVAFKAVIWNKLATELNTTDSACKEAYKALREKYIREREKLQQYGNFCKPWELIDHLQFLDPHISTRKGSNVAVPHIEDYVAIKQDPTSDTDYSFQDDTDSYNGIDNSTRNFCKTLIKMVYQAKALWDRNYKDYSDKQMKDHLWLGIANALQSDVTTCSLKWKSLREKYIRQKQKYTEGDHKWEFLDDLSFLDGVILYRKKAARQEDAYLNGDFEYECIDDGTNDSLPIQKQTPPSLLTHIPDSTLDTSNRAERKRTLSNASESSCHKTKRSFVHQERTTEQVYGELVAVMLAAKPEKEKKLAMMEIMSILTKSSN